MKYIRKTKDAYLILGNYGYGFEEVFEAETFKKASQTLKEYRNNEPQYTHKLRIKRVKL